MLATVYVFGWYEVALRIRSGDIATDLVRPLDPLRYWLAFDLGRALYHFVFRGIPPFVLGMLVFDVRLPEAPATWLWLALSLTLAVVVSFAFRFLYNLVAFWLVDYRGVGALATSSRSPSPASSCRCRSSRTASRRSRGCFRSRRWCRSRSTSSSSRRRARSWPARSLLQAAWALVLLGLARCLLGAAIRSVVIQGG